MHSPCSMRPAHGGKCTLILEFGGLCAPAGKHGAMSYGWLIRRSALAIDSGWACLPAGHGNSSCLAEYLGLIEGLQAVIQLREPGERLTVRSDARLVIKQVAGVWLGVSPGLWRGYRQARELVRRLFPVTFVLVAHEHNAAADALARAAYHDVLEAERRSRAGEVRLERLGDTRYRANGKYDLDSATGACTCPDYLNLCRRFHARCKHLFALEGHTLDE